VNFQRNLLLVPLFILIAGCQFRAEPGPSDQNLLIFTADIRDQKQTIHNFGASDAWSAQFVGENWPLEKREQIADLLFSTEMDSAGHPEGIGLSAWRFNIGAGSARQGEDSGIDDPWRRSESFLSADSTYNWSSQQGQQWFIDAAYLRGARTFTGFVNSPPILLTRNRMAFGDGGSRANIAPEQYDAFADYLANIATHFKEKGTPLTYISPVNEPQWDWSEGNGQEGSPYQNSEIAGVVSALDKAIKEYGLDTKIEIPETAQIDFLYDGDLEGRSKQTEFFFGDESTENNIPSLAHKMAGHSYFTTYPVYEMIDKRRQLWEDMQQIDPDLEYWMSEFCILGDVGDGLQGNGRDLGIDSGLYVARVMHYDLTVANASAWQWWLGISPYDYKDGLVYIDHDMNDGRVYDSKILWSMGNFSRFIRPGAIRVGMTRSDGLTPIEAENGVFSSAYIHQESGQFTSIIINYGSQPRNVRLELDSIDIENVSEFKRYITSAGSSLERQEPVDYGDPISIPARSIVTLITDIPDLQR